MKKTLFTAAVIAASSLAGSAAFAMKDSCNGLTGYYGNVTAIIVGEDGKTVNITLAGGRPNAYGECQANGNFTINFPDDPATTGGTFDGTTISWSNGTTWTKQ